MNTGFLNQKRIVLILVAVLLTYGAPSISAEVVSIPDPNLRAAIEKALGKASGATITADEMATLTELDARRANISDLTGLEHAINLIELDLYDNSISDISALSGLTNLKSLWLTSNSISDISALSGLSNLRTLYLGENDITDLSPLSGLTNLTYLTLYNNTITDISSLSGLTRLTYLHLTANNISDISPLSELTNLTGTSWDSTGLYLAGNPLSYASINTHIPAIQMKGGQVEFDNRAPTTLLNISGVITASDNVLIVEVWDNNNQAFEGVPVTFAVTSGGERSVVTSTTTDKKGRAQSTLTPGSDGEPNSVEASVADLAQTVTFSDVQDADIRKHNLMLRVVRVTPDWMPFASTGGWTRAVPLKESQVLKFYEVAIWEETSSVHLYEFPNAYDSLYGLGSGRTDEQKIAYREQFLIRKYTDMPDAWTSERSTFLKSAFTDIASYLVHNHPSSDHHLMYSGHGGPGGALFGAQLHKDHGNEFLNSWTQSLGRPLGVIDMGGPCNKGSFADLDNFCEYTRYYIASDLPNGGYTMDDWTLEKYQETNPETQYHNLFAANQSLEGVLRDRIDLRRKQYEYSRNNMIENRVAQGNYLYSCAAFRRFSPNFKAFLGRTGVDYRISDDLYRYLIDNNATPTLIEQFNDVFLHEANNKDFFEWSVVSNGMSMPNPELLYQVIPAVPDLVVERPTVSKSTLAPGESFTLSATVSNNGDGSAAATTLRYYRSTDVTITTGDTAVGTDSVGALAANRSGAENITLTAPNSPGTYYYGACVVSVSNESDKTNNCSDAVSITVEAEATNPSLSVSTASPLTEAVLDGIEVTLTLADGAFKRVLSTIRSAVTISGIAGVSVGTVERVSDTEIDIVLDFDGTDFDADATLTFSVAAGAIADYSGSSLTATRTVTAVIELEPELESLAIYWIDRGTNSIRTASLDGSSNEGIVTRGLKTPKGLALDITSGQVYWTDSGTDKIQRADLDGSNIEDLVTQGLEVTSGIALDVAGGKMYWTDSGTDKIQRADLDGSNVEDLVTGGLKNPRGLALDITNGHMYWTDKDTDKIQRADLDGSNVQDLVTRGLQLTTDLALDVMGGKMYWTDVGTGKIQRANLDGSNVEDLVTGLPGPNGITLDAAGRTMYWTDWHTNKIERADLDGSNVETLVSSSVNSPSSIAVASDGLPPIVSEPEVEPQDETEDMEFQAEDANRDGTVDVQDILFIAQRFNQTGQSNADVNGDEIVDVFDILAVAAVLVDNVSAAPSLRAQLPNDITAATIQQWLTEAELTGKITPVYQRGILVLEQLLAALTPEDTVLLANYPNPFNPETWIPYRLSTDADVTLTIYDPHGTVVRQLALGHQQAGFYTDRTKAAYWDGRNAVGERVASGAYFYQLRAGNYTAIRKMLILK